jgi:uncharacterized damage-inducible protein DinB
MTNTEQFQGQLEREAKITRTMLSRVPEGRNDWKPHEKSMKLGYLAHLVATMASWITMAIEQDELDLNPPGKPTSWDRKFETNREMLEAFDKEVARARAALAGTNDAHLMTPWRLLVAGKTVSEDPRHIVISDAVFCHLAHHRGQLSVYLRLNDVSVPVVYGPTADEGRF